MTVTPSFVGQKLVVLHRPSDAATRFLRRCELLGLRAEARWKPLKSDEAFDLVAVDADEGWDGLLPWAPRERPVPLIALLGSEAPGRIAWALDQGADALIAKPIVDSAIFPTLVMAARRFAEGRKTAERIARLEERVRLRPLVHAAVQHYMAAEHCGESEAYGRLRSAAMRSRTTVEQAAAALLASPRGKAG